MTSRLKKIENLDEVVDALERGKGEELISPYEDRERKREDRGRKRKYYIKKVRPELREQRRRDYEEFIQRVLREEILPNFSWQKGQEDEISFSALKRRTGFSESLLGRIGEYEVDYDGEKIKLKEFMYDSFVLDASPLNGIAIILGMNEHQRVQQYLENTGQYAKWRKQHQLQREEKEQDKEEQREYKHLMQEFASLLLTKVVQETKDNWPRQRAILVDSQKRKNSENIPLEKLEELFWHYQRAVEDNIPVGLDYLSDITGLEMNTVLRQLRRAGLEPFNPPLQKSFRKKMVCLSPAEKQRIKNGKNTFPRGDLSFFLGLPGHVIKLRLLPILDSRKTRYAIKNFSYRLASEIYQAREDLTPAEIQYVLGIDSPTYDKYLAHQREISRETIHKLRQIYPELGTKIKKPYLTPEIRQLQSEQTLESTVLRAIGSAMKTGARGIDELVRATGFSYITLRAYSRKKGITLPLKYKK